ncbi:hypothetical protein ACIQ6K_33910 [Streptomyces sp. NPDC096354]|jgi:hypothetical protein|uniref:hypothetical protein n=1 Tax=Streptomyces sp. NPDC096354 TaxID=3366088 RepID=UPI00381960DC
MAVDELMNLIMSWEMEPTRRGALVRAIQDDPQGDPVLQAERLSMLGLAATREFKGEPPR